MSCHSKTQNLTSHRQKVHQIYSSEPKSKEELLVPKRIRINCLQLVVLSNRQGEGITVNLSPISI